MLTGGHTTLLSPDAAQTAIDAVLYEEFEREQTPSYVGVENSVFFKRSGLSTIAFIWDEDSNVGAFEETGEQEEITGTDTFIANTKTVRSKKWTKSVPISDEAMRADQVGKRERIGMQIGERGRRTKDKEGLIRTYGDAFNGSFFTTPDGEALASNSHVALKNGDTVDNLETGALTPDTLWAGFVSLQTQLAQDGEVGGYMPTGVLTCTTQYKHLKEILNSEAVADSAENNLNIFETDYGRVSIGQSVDLNSAADAGTYKATAVHIVSAQHQIMRKVFYELNTDIIEPKYSRFDTYEYRARYHEVAFPGTWQGYVGMAGA